MAVTADKTDAPGRTGLRTSTLGFYPLLAQGIAAISPTMTAVLIIPLSSRTRVRAPGWPTRSARDAAVRGVLPQPVRPAVGRARTMYTYTARGLGPTAGVFSGWTLIWSYLFIADRRARPASPSSSASSCPRSATPAASPHPVLRDQRCDLLVRRLQGHPAVFGHHPGSRGPVGRVHPRAWPRSCCSRTVSPWIPRSSSLKGVGIHGMSLAIVACIFSLVGFESATALGGEASQPAAQRTAAVLASLVLTQCHLP